jgi:DNA replication protein DnaC
MLALQAMSNLGALQRLTFDSFQPDAPGLTEAVRANLHDVYETARSYASEPIGWLVLLGGYGCGKTHLAAAIANYRLALGNPVLFVVVPDLLDHFRAAFSPNSEVNLDERLESVRNSPLLILDDLGAHSSTPWAQEKMYQILNHRYNTRLPTVVTTNERLEDIDPRIRSRLVDIDLSQVRAITAPDYRSSGEKNPESSLNTLDLHRDKTFESFSERRQQKSVQTALELARQFAQDPRGWFVLSGATGCGKTHLAAAIGNYVASQQSSLPGKSQPLFVVVPDLLDHLRATFSPSSSTTLDRLFERVKTTELLILDDLGVESATPWAREKLFQLLNYRHAARLATVLTTMKNINELDPWLESRLLDKTRCVFHLITAPGFYAKKPTQKG